MGQPDSQSDTDAAAARSSQDRRRIWRRNLILFLGVVLLIFALDTLRNSGGDFRELWLSYKVERFIAAHPDLSEGDKVDLRAGRVVRGWNREMCRAAWGEPENVLTITQMGTEIWQYGGNTRPAMLVFTNGVLTDFGP